LNMAKQIDRVVCPLCMHNYIKKGVKQRFSYFDPQNGFFVLVEEAKGGKIAGTGKGYRGSAKGGGFTVLERLTIEDALNTHKYDDIIDAMKKQVINVARELIRIGVMKKTDI